MLQTAQVKRASVCFGGGSSRHGGKLKRRARENRRALDSKDHGGGLLKVGSRDMNDEI